MAVTASFNAPAGLLTEFGDDLDNTITTSRNAAGNILVNGGAVALGHPIGASGTRIVLTLVQELEERGGGIGVAAICSGGGQGDAIVVQVGS